MELRTIVLRMVLNSYKYFIGKNIGENISENQGETMQLYSEIYNCYYNIINNLLRMGKPFSGKELYSAISRYGFDETMLYLIPKIDSGQWHFFEKSNELYISTLNNTPQLILTTLQKRWLKTLLADKRIKLFLDDAQLELLERNLSDIEPLFSQEDFYIYDQFLDGDDYEDENYRANFRTILSAIEDKQYLNIAFHSHRDNRIHYRYLPCKLEYSVKNDCFRLLAMESRNRSRYAFHTINLSRITEISETGKYAERIPDINEYITKEYYDEPVTLMITNERNALERTMLQFASYKKNTSKLDDNTYKCEIYYNKSNETELLIEVLSFGSAIKVVGNEHFVKLLTSRLKKQQELFVKP